MLTTTIPTVGRPIRLPEGPKSIQASVQGTGAISATVLIEVSNHSNIYLPHTTLTLSGTNVATDGFTDLGDWSFWRASVTAISGTDAIVTVNPGV